MNKCVALLTYCRARDTATSTNMCRYWYDYRVYGCGMHRVRNSRHKRWERCQRVGLATYSYNKCPYQHHVSQFDGDYGSRDICPSCNFIFDLYPETTKNETKLDDIVMEEWRFLMIDLGFINATPAVYNNEHLDKLE